MIRLVHWWIFSATFITYCSNVHGVTQNAAEGLLQEVGKAQVHDIYFNFFTFTVIMRGIFYEQPHELRQTRRRTVTHCLLLWHEVVATQRQILSPCMPTIRKWGTTNPRHCHTRQLTLKVNILTLGNPPRCEGIKFKLLWNFAGNLGAPDCTSSVGERKGMK